MTVTTGPNIGLLINAEIGEEYYAALTSFLRGVDGLIQPRVGDKDLSAPPSALSNGVMYIVGANPTGAWAGKAGQLARWFSVGAGSPAWEFYVPKLGWSVRVLDELDSNGVAKEYVYGSAGWVVPAGGSGGGGVAESYTVVAPSGGALNLSNPATTIWGVNLNANVTSVTLPSNLSAPTGITLIITQDNTGGRTITWPSNVTWNGAAPTIKSTANGKTMLGLLTVDGGANWLGTSIPTSGGSGSGMVNPMTAKGSLIVGGTAGAAEELLVGAAGQVLTVSSSGTLVWTTPSGGGGGDFKADGTVRMTGPITEAPGVNMNTSSQSIALASATSNTVYLGTGARVEDLGSGLAGVKRLVQFQNDLLLVNSASLALPGRADINAKQGDWASFLCVGNAWECTGYTKKDGTALVAPAGGGDFKKDGSVQMTGPINNAPLVRMNLTDSGIIPAYTALSNTIQVDGGGGDTIISLGTIPVGGIRRRIVIGYSGVTIRHSDTLSLPGGTNIVTALGDSFDFESTSQGTTGVEGWRLVGYLLKSGRSLISAPDTSALDLAGTRTMTGPVNEAPIQDVRSYSTSQPTTNLAVTQSNVLNLIYWDASITSFGTAPKGFRRTIVRTGYTGDNAGQDTGPVTLVHNATSLRLPGGVNITTSIGDSFEVVSLGGGNWFVEWYQKANGRALVADGFTEDQVRNTLLTGLALVRDDVRATDTILAALGKLQDSKVTKESGKGLSETSFSQDEKTKLNVIQAGATANSTDAFLLARANHTGTQVISTINGLPEALNSKVDIVAGKGLSTNDYTTPEKSKLAGVEAGATANSLDSFLLARANHTGTQAISTVSGLQDALDTKVGKVDGKDLSSNDYTTSEKNKLAGIAEGAQVNSVTSVAGRTGAVVLSSSDVGLGNVNNTADSVKPVSTPQQTAINASKRNWTGSVTNVNSSRALLVSETGGAFRCTPTSAITLTLPGSGAQPPGGAPYLIRNESAVVVTISAATLIYSSSAAQSMTLDLQPNEWVEIASNVGSWVVNERGRLDAAVSPSSPSFTDDLMLTRYSGSASASANIIMQRLRGSAASPSPVLANDRIGSLTFQTRASDGTDYGNVVLEAYAREDQTATGKGALLQFSTVKVGSTARSVALAIDNAGQVSMPNGFYAGAPGRLAAFTLSTLPSAAAWTNFLIIVTNATGGSKVCWSNGTNWCLLNTSTVVS